MNANKILRFSEILCFSLTNALIRTQVLKSDVMNIATSSKYLAHDVYMLLMQAENVKKMSECECSR